MAWDQLGWCTVGGAGINSIQHGQIEITGGTSGTATITEVDTTKSLLLFLGVKTDLSGTVSRQVRIELTNATTVTGYVNTSPGGNKVYVNFVVVEFTSGIKNVQAGTITLTDAEETDTITTVDTEKAFVVYLGETTAISNDEPRSQCVLTLTNATTVTATATQANASLTVGYMVFEFS